MAAAVTARVVAEAGTAAGTLRVRGDGGGAAWVVETRADPAAGDRLRAGGEVSGTGRWVLGAQSFLAPASGPGWTSALTGRDLRRVPVAGTGTGETGVSWVGHGGAWRAVAAWGRTESGAERGRAEVVRGGWSAGGLRGADGDRWWFGGSGPGRGSVPWALEVRAGHGVREARAAAGGGAFPLGALVDAARGGPEPGWRARGGARFTGGFTGGSIEVETTGGGRARGLRVEAGAGAGAGPWSLRLDGRGGQATSSRWRAEASASTGGHRWEVGAEAASRRLDAVDLSGTGRAWRLRVRLPADGAVRWSASAARRTAAGTLRAFAERGPAHAFGLEWTRSVRTVDFAEHRGKDRAPGGVP